MFQNREEAGKLLAKKLAEYKNSTDAIVFAIPRGGVIVGNEIAKILHLSLSVVVVRKLGAPGNPELAIGAIAGNDVYVIDEELISILGVEEKYLDEEIRGKRRELQDREKKFSAVSNKLSIKDKNTVILTDDGVATGATTLAAIKYVKKVLGARCQVLEKDNYVNNLKHRTYNLKPKIILAVPVVARDTYDKLKSEVEKIVALEIPESLRAVGEFYRDFPQITDEEVKTILGNL